MNLIKTQIPLCISKALAISVSLATIGVCVFCASASVGALFILYRKGDVFEKCWLVCVYASTTRERTTAKRV